jgi:hypothetical protein
MDYGADQVLELLVVMPKARLMHNVTTKHYNKRVIKQNLFVCDTYQVQLFIGDTLLSV